MYLDQCDDILLVAEVKDPLTGETQLDLDGYYVKNGEEKDGFPVWYNDVKVSG